MSVTHDRNNMDILAKALRKMNEEQLAVLRMMLEEASKVASSEKTKSDFKELKEEVWGLQERMSGIELEVERMLKAPYFRD